MTLNIAHIDTHSPAQSTASSSCHSALYHDCPQWVPPLVDDVKLMLNRSSYPFYEHSDADFFVAERDGRDRRAHRRAGEPPLQRALGAARPRSSTYSTPEDDAEAADGALRCRRGLGQGRRSDQDGRRQRLPARATASASSSMGSSITRPSASPTTTPYYATVIEGAGLPPPARLLVGVPAGQHRLPCAGATDCREDDGAPRLHHQDLRQQERAARPGCRASCRLYNDTFVDNWEFNPVTDGEAKVIGERLLQIADPKLIKLVMKGDDIAGFLFGFPDISEGIRRANGPHLAASAGSGCCASSAHEVDQPERRGHPGALPRAGRQRHPLCRRWRRRSSPAASSTPTSCRSRRAC